VCFFFFFFFFLFLFFLFFFSSSSSVCIRLSPALTCQGVQLSAVDGNPFPGCDSVKQTDAFKTGEEVFTCVQCQQRYIEIENDILANACSFHVSSEKVYGVCLSL
jgi:hypothetical protein